MKTKTPRAIGHCSIILLLLAGLVAGCRSGPGSASFASVTIDGRSTAEIQRATEAVFKADGYQLRTSGNGEAVFEKEGSRMTGIAYGGLVATHEGSQTWVRVRTRIVDLGQGASRLQCKAYMVANYGEGGIEDEKPLTNIRSGPYQKLLDKVADQLKQP